MKATFDAAQPLDLDQFAGTPSEPAEPTSETLIAAAPQRTTLVALGSFGAKERTRLAGIADQATLDLELCGSAEQARESCAGKTPHSILVDASLSGCEEFCCDVRAQSHLAQVPVLALSPELNDLSFASAFSWGGDDAVSLRHPRALLERLRRLPKDGLVPPSARRGRALVCEPDHTRRVALAGVLRNAGYQVTFAVEHEDTLSFARSPEFALVVINAELDAHPRAVLEEAREAGSDALWILTSAPRSLAELREQLVGTTRATVCDGFAPPENVLFLANELGRNQGVDNRASARLLYGTRVDFRAAGLEQDDQGYSYNVSLGGLYVRTLNPPGEDVVWLELTPPRSDRRVRLEGQVAWRRPWGPNGTATVPPGFGVQITDGTSRDIDAWREGYRAFARALS
ncbi:MAG: PilZ domain-containing protein [Myxococcales bacterium]|nr:PilZ domain-containing protein [Myxococcales bacterium]